jgi:phosphatidate cytidylyltransferase
MSYADPPDRHGDPAHDNLGAGPSRPGDDRSGAYGSEWSPGDDYPGQQRARHDDAAPDAFRGGEFDFYLEFERLRAARESEADGGRAGRRRTRPRRREALPGRRSAADTGPGPGSMPGPAGVGTESSTPAAGVRTWGDPAATAEIVGLRNAPFDGSVAADYPGPDPVNHPDSDPDLHPGPDPADPQWAAAPGESPPVPGDVDRSGQPSTGPAEPSGGSAEPGPSAAEPAKKNGRAGRNLRAAIGVGVGLGAIILISLFPWRQGFIFLAGLAIAVATWEMARAVRASEARPPLVPLVAGGVAMAGLAWAGGPEALTLGLVATAVAALVWRLSDGPLGYQRDLVAAMLIAVYVPFLGSFMILLLRPEDGNLRVLAALAGVVLSDTGGYAAGVFFGRHAMAPSVSPKKSWEGMAGSVLAAAAGGAVMLYLMFGVVWWQGALFGVAVSVASVLGDLAESLIKRDLKIKDMSTLLPGHGGLMDRLDSILLAAPTAYAVLMLVAPVVT